MKPSPAHAEARLSGPDDFDEQQTAFRFDEARAHVRNAVRCAEADGISRETMALALIGEALPPIVHKHGPAWAAKQKDQPTRAEAIRRLVELGLKAKGK